MTTGKRWPRPARCLLLGLALGLLGCSGVTTVTPGRSEAMPSIGSEPASSAVAARAPGQGLPATPTAAAIEPSPAGFVQPTTGAAPTPANVTQEEMTARAVAYVLANPGMRSGEPEVLLSRRVSVLEWINRSLPEGATPAPLLSLGPSASPIPAPSYLFNPDTALYLVILQGAFDLDIRTGREAPDGTIEWSIVPVTYISLLYDLSVGEELPLEVGYRCSGASFKRLLNDPSLPDEEPKGKFGLPCA